MPQRTSRKVGRTIGRTVTRAMVRPGTYPGFLKEVAMAGMNIALYPAGLLSDALKIDAAVRLGDGYNPQTPLRYLNPEAASTPIVLVHGALHNHSAFMMMRRTLKRYGYRCITTMDYSTLGHTVEELAQELATHVQRVQTDTGATHVNIVGHSLGGLIARYYVQELGGHERVRTCVTLGTPHQGTYAAIIGRGRAARQLLPGSPLLKQLKRGARKPLPTRFVCFYSNLDSLILPSSNAKLIEPGLKASNILVKDLGHLSLLVSRPLLRSVAELLAREDEPVVQRRARTPRASKGA